jgi:hypothetical protein
MLTGEGPLPLGAALSWLERTQLVNPQKGTGWFPFVDPQNAYLTPPSLLLVAIGLHSWSWEARFPAARPVKKYLFQP